MHPPPLLLRAEKKRSAVHGVGEEEGWGTDEDGPLLLQDGFVLCGKRMQVWCRLERLVRLFPLPLTPLCGRASGSGEGG